MNAKILYTNHSTNEKIQSDDANLPYICELIKKLAGSKGTLLTNLPSGMSLDIDTDEDGNFLIEFMGGLEAKWALVSPAVAEDVFKRAFNGPDRDLLISIK